MAIKAFKSVAAAITLSTTAALAPGFTAQAEAQAVQISAENRDETIAAYQQFARGESDDEVVIMVVQPVGGDQRALDRLEQTLNRLRGEGVRIASFVIEAEGHQGTDIYGYAIGRELFDYNNYDNRDVARQAGIIARDVERGWGAVQSRQEMLATTVRVASPESEGRDPR